MKPTWREELRYVKCDERNVCHLWEFMHGLAVCELMSAGVIDGTKAIYSLDLRAYVSRGAWHL